MGGLRSSQLLAQRSIVNVCHPPYHPFAPFTQIHPPYHPSVPPSVTANPLSEEDALDRFASPKSHEADDASEGWGEWEQGGMIAELLDETEGAEGAPSIAWVRGRAECSVHHALYMGGEALWEGVVCPMHCVGGEAWCMHWGL